MPDEQKGWPDWAKKELRAALSKEAIIPGIAALVAATAGLFSGLSFLMKAAIIGIVALCFFAIVAAISYFRSAAHQARRQSEAMEEQTRLMLEQNKTLEAQKVNIEQLSTLAEKWRELDRHTGICDFSPRLMDSEFAPVRLIRRENITNLIFMGNGCSKWTSMLDGDKDALVKFFYDIQRNSGHIRFLAACPKYHQEKHLIQKAGKNATSLIKLKQIIDASFHENGKFEFRVYHEPPAWRLTILNQEECIVGHYGGGDSRYTPLLVVRQSQQAWGFLRAFDHVFKMKWDRATEVSDEDWKAYRKIAKDAVEVAE